jgi:hypothetical protein
MTATGLLKSTKDGKIRQTNKHPDPDNRERMNEENKLVLKKQ